MSINPGNTIAAATIAALPARGADKYAYQLRAILLQQLTWVVLIAYTLSMLKPVMPVIMDGLAHTFWEQRHILTVHEVNGKFHIHSELAQASHQSEKDKKASGKYEAAEYLPVAATALPAYPSLYFVIMDTYHHYYCFYPPSFFDVENPPPEA